MEMKAANVNTVNLLVPTAFCVLLLVMVSAAYLQTEVSFSLNGVLE